MVLCCVMNILVYYCHFQVYELGCIFRGCISSYVKPDHIMETCIVLEMLDFILYYAIA
jgi:hypothetical protein